MKGIVFNLLEEAVCQEHGEDAWDGLLEASGLDGVYTSLGNYADEDLLKLITAASKALNLSPAGIVRWFGRAAIPLMAKKYPVFFQPHQTTRPFLLTLNTIIHPEVRKIYPGADVPVFDYDTASEEFLLMGYKSAKKMCAFAEGLIEGASAYYGEKVLIEQPNCMNRGDEKCLFKIQFDKA